MLVLKTHMPRVSISLATYNSERYARTFCRSLLSQTFTDWELLVVDNNSFDHSVEIIQELIPNARIFRQKKNLGFARAHNLVIGWTSSPYVFVVNHDMIFEPDCLEKMVAAMDRVDDVAAVGGALLYWDFEEHKTTRQIDSMGLSIMKSYRIVDRLQGEQMTQREAEQVFGVSGAMVLLRRAALDAVKIPVRNTGSAHGFEFFDEDFFCYKEDADLAWRLAIAGWKSYVDPVAVAYHHRNVTGQSAGWHDRKQRREINRYSYRNHLLMIYKNHFWPVTLRHLLAIKWFEFQKFWYLLFLDRSSLTGLGEALRFYPKMRRKRRQIQAKRRLTTREFNEWLQ